MSRQLGMSLTTAAGFRHAIGLARAAARAGIRTEVFLTGDGVQATRDPSFADLLAVARLAICETSYVRAGLRKQDVPGLQERDFATQGRHAEIVDACDRYIIL